MIDGGSYYDDASLEELAAAIDAADRGHMIELTSLTEAGRVYTLDLRDGTTPRAFGSFEEADDYSERARSLARAQAALTFLRPASTPNDEATDEPRPSRSTPNDE